MKKLLTAVIIALSFLGSLALVVGPEAIAQCNGVFPANTICGKLTSSGIPGPLSNSVLTGVPGGTSGQIQYNNGGNFGGFTPGALTATSDTNVSITLGGTPSTALVSATSITIGWSGQLSMARGGTGTSSFTSSGILYGNGTSTPGSDRCLMDSASDILCASATTQTPIFSVQNVTNDANSVTIRMDKNRASTSSTTNDVLGRLLYRGFAGGAQQSTGEVRVTQTAAVSGTNVPGKIQLLTSTTSGQLNVSMTLDTSGHISVTPSAQPSLGSCGAGATVSGTDHYGTITAGTAMTACTLLFAQNYVAVPHCTVTWQVVGTSASSYSPAVSGIAITQSSNSNNKMNYVCFGG